jgi:cytochrome c-type biogenesis protein CcmH
MQRVRILRFTCYGLLLLALLAVALPVVAQRVVTDDEVNEVAKDLYCPVCESTPLDVCPTQACADWRELIRQQLGEGKTRAEVLDYFTRQYGDGVLANPPKEGFNLIVWLLPVVAIVVGGAIFVHYMGLLRAADTSTPIEAPASNETKPRAVTTPSQHFDDYIARVEEELQSK